MRLDFTDVDLWRVYSTHSKDVSDSISLYKI